MKKKTFNYKDKINVKSPLSSTRKIEKPEKERVEGIVRVFQVFSMIIFALLIGFLLLNICTSRRKIGLFLGEYVNSVEINEEYYNNYIEYGFTKEQCEELIRGKNITKLVTEVLTDRIMALCHNTSTFKYSAEDCMSVIKTEISLINVTENLNLTEKTIDSLTQYTFDIIGFQTMFKYNNPQEYRDKVFNEANPSSDIILDNATIFKTISTLTSLSFPIGFLIMYVICLIIITVVYKKGRVNKLYQLLCDTALYPSFILFGFSIGQMMIKTKSLTTGYIFRNLLWLSIAGIFFAILIALITYKLQAKKRSKKGRKNGKIKYAEKDI